MVFRSTSNRRIVEGYATALRTIVSDSFGLSVDQKKYDYYYDGRAEWLTRVHSIALNELTPATIQKWKQSFLAKAGSILYPFVRLASGQSEYVLEERRAPSARASAVLRIAAH